MDWNWKTPTRDFVEFQGESNSNMTSIASLGRGEMSTRGDFLVDLKLGRFGDFRPAGLVEKCQDPRVFPMVPPSSSSSSMSLSAPKRARVPKYGIQTAVSCLVDGCNSDLSKCRDYHRRHKVCEVHSKTPKVTIGGLEQRFCQQCSRFHLLVEFDESKRSCRKRLDGHNRRRRKPQPGSLTGSFFSNHQGAGFSQFSSSRLFPSTIITGSTWISDMETEDKKVSSWQPSLHLIDRQSLLSRSSSPNFKVEKQFPFLHDNNAVRNHQQPHEVPSSQSLFNSIVSSQSNEVGSRKRFPNGLTQVMGSDCALSLLSSPPKVETSGINPGHSIPMGLPLASALHYNDVLRKYQPPGIKDGPVGSVLVSAGSETELQCQDTFHTESDASEHGSPQTFPFSWE